MDITAIPFVRTVGIETDASGRLRLPFRNANENHLASVHASAQFALAETASGDALQRLFPELSGHVVPLLRDGGMKFRKPAMAELTAYPTVSEDVAAKFREQFAKKRRATITVQVELKDAEGTVTAVGQFEWFIQALSPAQGNGEE